MVEHYLPWGEEPEFEVWAGFREQPWPGLDEPEGCVIYTPTPFFEEGDVPQSAGTLFFDSGQEPPWALPSLAGEYTDGRFLGTWGAEMALTSVGEDLPPFDWDPALRLPEEPLHIDIPSQDEEIFRGDLELYWTRQPDSLVRALVAREDRDVVLCEEEDDGHLLVPADLLNPEDGRVQVSVSRVSLWWRELEPGRFVEIEVNATDWRTLIVEEP